MTSAHDKFFIVHLIVQLFDFPTLKHPKMFTVIKFIVSDCVHTHLVQVSDLQCCFVYTRESLPRALEIRSSHSWLVVVEGGRRV